VHQNFDLNQGFFPINIKFLHYNLDRELIKALSPTLPGTNH
jgi:hypothetical protein